MTRNSKYIVALFFGSMLPAIIYILVDWRSYINFRTALSTPGTGICPSEDTACAQEVLGERWTDFIISATVGFLSVYFVTLIVAVLILVAIDQMRSRVRINSAES